MKKLFLALLGAAPWSLLAQSSGTATSGGYDNRSLEPHATHSVLNINTSPTYFTDVNIQGVFTPVTIFRRGSQFRENDLAGLRATSLADASFSCGIEGLSLEASLAPYDASSRVRSYGVKGHSEGGSEGASYGVFGTVKHKAGAGVYGGFNGDKGVVLDRSYAGFFNGDTKVAGDLEVAGGVKGMLLREVPANTSPLSAKTALYYVRSLQAVGYWKGEKKELDLDKKPYQSTIEAQNFGRRHYAVRVGDKDKARLGYKDESGKEYISYSDLVPLLVGAINALYDELDQLKANQNKPAAAQPKVEAGVAGANVAEAGGVVGFSSAMEGVSLAANFPNPFHTTTTIELSLPQTVGKAQLVVYNLAGQLHQVYDIAERGAVSLSLSATDFEAGVYLYTLMVDGHSQGTHRMMVTH